MKIARRISKVILGIITVGVILFSLIVIMFPGLLPGIFVILTVAGSCENTVVETIESPDGSCYVEVINSDHGAMGGCTLVNLHEDGFINKIFDKSEEIYRGNFGEAYNIDIYFKDNDCLVINGTEYTLN